MRNMPDNDLDELFKTAADNVQYEFKQEAWQSMHKQMKQSNAKRRGAYWLSGLLLALLAIVFVRYYIWQPKQPQSTAVSVQANQASTNEKGTNKGSVLTPRQLPSGNTQATNRQQTTPATDQTSNQTPTTSEVIASNKNTLPKTNSNKLPKAQKRSNLPPQGYTYNKVFTPANGNHMPPVPPTRNNQGNVRNDRPKPNNKNILAGGAYKATSTNQTKNPEKDKQKDKVPTKNNGKATSKPPLYAMANIKGKPTTTTATVLPYSLSQEKKMVATKSKTKQNKPSRLNLIAQIAPDLSMVDKMSMSDTRWNAGLLVEYEFIKNLSISTGVNYSAKAYGASAEAYTPQDGAWKWGRVPENIAATCRVLEVPVNLRYYFHNQPKHRLFISSGISSYWMLKENYNFDYGDQKVYNYSWGVSNENQHMLSIINLSVGWQKQLNHKWSIQAEPFLKIPLGKVGAGKVSLKTTGIMLGLKYKLFK